MITYKIRRFNIEGFEIRGKKYLSPEEEFLLSKKVFVQEKVDGKFTCRDFGDFLILCEDLRDTHTIYYKNLPSRFLGFDVYQKDEGFLEVKEAYKIMLEYGIIPVPIIYVGKVDKEMIKNFVLEKNSEFLTEINPKMRDIAKEVAPDIVGKKNFIEGVVVKYYENNRLYAGKAVNPAFEKIGR
ncbi:RNA ligase family protein [Archaeoglobus profundus]|uniref:RNA ligase domain-containing protein n=1 Tax=Archaeoglobus profundus (strain DSM 5631 / JCM 9629 / NBRC 100127 / Av18) TaxID=572546 RepID=D2RH97_ARCPA|nr:RNA ligase family protein [Archaeoglobus profundus]ADB57672.1 hypothetical protein Arcpr_0607 [Archaeoglobus profundus DSM 5631]